MPGLPSLHPVVLDLPGWRDPLEILRRSVGAVRACLLWSGAGDPALARHSIFAANPFMSAAGKEAGARIQGPDGAEESRLDDPFSLLSGLMARHPCAGAGAWPFPGGAIGFFSYDAARALERLPASSEDDRPHPWLDFGVYSWSVNWDHSRRRWAVLATGAPLRAGRAAENRARATAETVAAWVMGDADGKRLPPGADLPPPPEFTDGDGALRASLDREAYKRAVAAIQERIGEGDCYEVNLSRRLSVASAVDPRRLFLEMAEAGPAPFAAYIEGSEGILVGASPERFLRVRSGLAESRPIKGTAGRVEGAAADREAAERLLLSEKDRAENVMIVDLVRNDLGRVCRPGTIEVATLCGLESFASVHHLVSAVTGRLEDGLGALDAARALFPPGSMTGAPKIRAMEVIEEMEPIRRGPYAGAAGYVSAGGDADLSVVIRTHVISPRCVDLQAGGAVVADSDPDSEFEESVVKVGRALAALERALGRSLGKASVLGPQQV